MRTATGSQPGVRLESPQGWARGATRDAQARGGGSILWQAAEPRADRGARLVGAATVAVLASWSPPNLGATEAKLHFDQITVEDGLAFNWVTTILKDSRGFLWFGTSDGLDRYDGRAFRHYRGDPTDPAGLSSRLVAALFEDSHAHLWVGSAWAHAGVARYDREHDRFRRLPPESCGRDGRAFAEDRAGRVWIGNENGLARYEEDQDRCTPFPFNTPAVRLTAGPAVVAMQVDRKGRFWVGTVSGLWRFDTESGRYVRWPGSSEAADGARHRRGRRACTRTRRARSGSAPWAPGSSTGTPRRASCDATSRDPTIRRASATCVFVVSTGNGRGLVFVGTENGGLCILDTRTGKFTRHLPDIDDPHSLSAVSIWSLLVDDQDILWIGTYNGGVEPAVAARPALPSDRGTPRRSRRPARLGGARGPSRRPVGRDQRRRPEPLRAAGRVGSRTIATIPNDPQTIGSDAVLTLLEDSRGSMWLGGWDGGMGRIDPASGRVRRFRADPADPRSLPGNDVWRILELSTGELLVTTQTGSALFDRQHVDLPATLAALRPGRRDGRGARCDRGPERRSLGRRERPPADRAANRQDHHVPERHGEARGPGPRGPGPAHRQRRQRVDRQREGAQLHRGRDPEVAAAPDDRRRPAARQRDQPARRRGR